MTDDTTRSAAPAAPAAPAAIRQVLTEHFLMGVNCGNITHPGEHDGEDNPMCACSRVFLGWHPSIGAAVQAWIDHFLAALDAALPHLAQAAPASDRPGDRDEL